MSKIYNKYLELKQIDDNKLYLFRCGKFYIFLAEDCDLINEYMILKKTKFTNEVYKCGFPSNSLDNYMRVFKNHNLNIEIVEEVEDKQSLSQILKEIKGININEISPINALLKLNELINILNK